MSNKKDQFYYLAPLLLLMPLGCSSPPKSEGEEPKSITANVDAIPLTAPVEFAEDLNKVVEDMGVRKDNAVVAGKSKNKTSGKPGAPDESKDESKDQNKDEKTAAAATTAAGAEAKPGEASEKQGASGDEQRMPASGETHIIYYTVKSGDTLMKVSFNVFGDLTRWKEIFELNKATVTNPNLLTKGSKLKIKVFNVVAVKRNGDPYAIKRGDTLGKISNWVYGTFTRWKDLWNNNRELIHDPNKIYAGFKLYYIKDKPLAQTQEPERSVAEVPKPAEPKLEGK